MAIDYDKHFLPAYDAALKGQDGKSRPRPNAEQAEGITSGKDKTVYLVAGPGTGKTTVLSLRILKLIACDQVPPNAILATTFTVKAAAELRSRILGWGYKIFEALAKTPGLAKADQEWLAKVDLNQVVTGTLDSLCQEALRQHREPGMQPPLMVDEYLANTVLVRQGLFPDGLHQNPDLDAWLLGIRNNQKFGWNLGSKRQILMSLWDRMHQDQVLQSKLIKKQVEEEVQAPLASVYDRYRDYLKERGWLDFAMLENEVLTRLRSEDLKDWAKQFRVVLVDEYQDSNLLQEQIYFELAKRSGASLTIVGDDDQSLYRFRGATVEIFTQFPERYAAFFGKPKPKPIFLNTNYRSTQQIIGFVNDFIERDNGYQTVRVDAKPQIENPKAKSGLPVLGIFRNDLDELTVATADFIEAVLSADGFDLPGGHTLKLGKHGALGDLCLLASSPQEYKPTPPQNPSGPAVAPDIRLPGRLRQEFEARDPSANNLKVFNPRGRPLAELEIIQEFGGMLLEAIDPRGVVQATDAVQKRIGNDAKRFFPDWRNAGRARQQADKALGAFVKGWSTRNPGRAGYEWPRSVQILELLYGLVHYLPDLHDQPEGQVYLEVFSRQLAAMSNVSKFEGRLVSNPSKPELSERSVVDLLCDWLAPIADSTVEVDEEMTGSFPRDHLPILSIHQSKGLEFPLVLVDIGSEFKSNHHANAFKRFPRDGGVSHNLEDLLRPVSDLKGIPVRSSVDRAFDDLERLYFVAYSRAQEVLVLLGLTKSKPDNAQIANIAAGWDRDGNQHGGSWDILYL